MQYEEKEASEAFFRKPMGDVTGICLVLLIESIWLNILLAALTSSKCFLQFWFRSAQYSEENSSPFLSTGILQLRHFNGMFGVNDILGIIPQQ